MVLQTPLGLKTANYKVYRSFIQSTSPYFPNEQVRELTSYPVMKLPCQQSRAPSPKVIQSASPLVLQSQSVYQKSEQLLMNFSKRKKGNLLPCEVIKLFEMLP